MKAVFKREIRNFFVTPIGYIFITFFLLLSAFMYLIGVLAYQAADMSGFFMNLPLILIFLIPVLTMRTIAEERRNKTDQLLLTSPVSVTEIVLGKYFAALCVFLIALLATVVYPIILFVFGKPQIGLIISQYIGFFLYGAAFIAVGVYVSSFTENQVIAAIASFGALFSLNFIDILSNISQDLNFAQVIKFISVSKRFEDFYYSILNPSSIIYFIAMGGVFIFLTIRSLEKRRHI